MLADPACSQTVGWSECGLYFIIWDKVDLKAEVVPKHFKNQYATFCRNLNQTGFVRCNSKFATSSFFKAGWFKRSHQEHQLTKTIKHAQSEFCCPNKASCPK